MVPLSLLSLYIHSKVMPIPLALSTHRTSKPAGCQKVEEKKFSFKEKLHMALEHSIAGIRQNFHLNSS